MKIAIVTLLQVASALLAQEAADARGNATETSRLLAVRSAVDGALIALTAVNEEELNTAIEKVAERLSERRTKN